VDASPAPGYPAERLSPIFQSSGFPHI